MIGLLRAGTPRAGLPGRFGRVNAVRKRFRRLAQEGIWPAAFEALQGPDLGRVMPDSSMVRAHQHAAVQRSTPEPAAIGSSRGGLTTKVHTSTDAPGNALRLFGLFCKLQ